MLLPTLAVVVALVVQDQSPLRSAPHDSALRETALYAPRIARRITSGIHLRSIEGGVLCLTANFAVLQTMQDQPSELFLCGSCRDRVVDDGGELRFAERLFIYDSTIVPTSLVYPV